MIGGGLCGGGGGGKDWYGGGGGSSGYISSGNDVTEYVCSESSTGLAPAFGIYDSCFPATVTPVIASGGSRDMRGGDGYAVILSGS